MEYSIERIDTGNYVAFDAMLRWRMAGEETGETLVDIPGAVQEELRNPNLYVYAVRVQGRYVGWLSAVYMPKVSKWQGHGHVYVDELWVAPPYRRQGLAKARLAKADELATALNAWGTRLYVNVDNPEAKALYESCGYREDGRAFFMEK